MPPKDFNGVSIFELMMFLRIRSNLLLDDVTYDNTSSEWKDDLAYKTMMVVANKINAYEIYKRYKQAKERCSNFDVNEFLHNGNI